MFSPVAEGFECKAIAGAQRFLQRTFVPYIFMEWKRMFISQHHPQTPCSTQAMTQLTQSLTQRGYIPYEVRTGFQLNPIRGTTKWKIGDLYWRHKTAKVLQDPF